MGSNACLWLLLANAILLYFVIVNKIIVVVDKSSAETVLLFAIFAPLFLPKGRTAFFY